MEHHVIPVVQAIEYIENHLDGRPDLDTVASAIHYSKYHLHRMFVSAVGMTIHDYALRRGLTEAAKLLVFSEKPVIEIALRCGYESQQAFTAAFKAMYKLPPAEYREHNTFYPLQLRFSLHDQPSQIDIAALPVRPAESGDIPAWMDLVRLVIDGFPCLDEPSYLGTLRAYIDAGQALIMEHGGMAIGIMLFSRDTGCIDFFGVHPQFRRRGVHRAFLDALMQIHLPGREISITTFREKDRADTGHRAQLLALGFAERELLVEFGYPTQRFVLPSSQKEDSQP